MLSTAFEDFEKGVSSVVSLLALALTAALNSGADFRDTMHSVLGTGVFNSDGQYFFTRRVAPRSWLRL